jgi:hypothetical protein
MFNGIIGVCYFVNCGPIFDSADASERSGKMQYYHNI